MTASRRHTISASHVKARMTPRLPPPRDPAGIEGVGIHPLRQIPDSRGKIMHMLRCDEAHFERFGEIYFSMAFPGAIKAWHLHQRMTLNYAVVTGRIKLVLYDGRKRSRSFGQLQEIFTGEDFYALVKVPPGVWNGFTALGMTPAIVANCATEPHDPHEILRKDPYDPTIPYQWDVRQQEAV